MNLDELFADFGAAEKHQALGLPNVRDRLQSMGISAAQLDQARDAAAAAIARADDPVEQRAREQRTDAQNAARDQRIADTEARDAIAAGLRGRGLNTPAAIAKATDVSDQELATAFRSKNDLVQLRKSVDQATFDSVLSRLSPDHLAGLR